MIHQLTKNIIASERTVGIITMGSTGSNMSPHSDIDLAIILTEDSPEIFSAIGNYESHILDIYFFKESVIKKLLETESNIAASSMEGKLIEWVHNGNIHYDRNGLLDQLKRSISINDLDMPDDQDLYNTWFGVNFNYLHNLRYFKSNEDLYLQALEIRLLYSLLGLIEAYFKFKDVKWKGEKEAIKYLMSNDKEYLELFQFCMQENNLNLKFKQYSKLVDLTLKYYSTEWNESFIHVILNKDYSPKTSHEANIFVENLLKDK